MQYIINVPAEQDLKFRAQFPDPDLLFKKVVADAVQAEDLRQSELSKPEVVRMDEALVEVAVVEEANAVDISSIATVMKPE